MMRFVSARLAPSRQYVSLCVCIKISVHVYICIYRYVGYLVACQLARAFQLLCQLLPDRRQLLAVPAPGRMKLHLSRQGTRGLRSLGQQAIGSKSYSTGILRQAANHGVSLPLPCIRRGQSDMQAASGHLCFAMIEPATPTSRKLTSSSTTH